MARYVNNVNLLTGLLCVSFVLISKVGFTDPAADQALQQLRMLQKQLAPPSASGNTGDPQPVTVTMGSNNNLSVKPTVNQPLSPTTTTTTVDTPPGTTPSITASTAQVPLAPPVSQIDEEAFKQVENQLFPLEPAQIIELKQKYQTSEFAQATTPGTPPKPTATSQFVNLSPGATPPVIRLSQGFVSSLVFLDSTGAPWPISAYDLGDPSSFNIQWDKSSNTLMIQAIKLYNYGNLAVRLVGLNTPVMLTLIPGQKAVDYRVDLRVQGYGPNASSLPMEQGLPPSANDILLHILEGVPPAGSRRLVVSGGDARGWLLNEKMFIRTNLTILSPGWIGSMTSADGMHAYEMQKSPVLLVSWHGKVMQLKIEGL